MSVHFLYFLFKWGGVKPTNMSNKIGRKFLILPLTIKEREEEKHNSNFKNIISKTLEMLSIVQGSHRPGIPGKSWKKPIF